MASPNRLPFIVHAAEWNEATNYKRIDSPTTVTFSGNPSAAQQAMMLSMFGPNAGTAIFNGAEMNIISGEITRTRSGTNIRFVDSDQPESEEAEGNDTNANTQDQEQYRSDGPGPDGNPNRHPVPSRGSAQGMPDEMRGTQSNGGNQGHESNHAASRARSQYGNISSRAATQRNHKSKEADFDASQGVQ